MESPLPDPSPSTSNTAPSASTTSQIPSSPSTPRQSPPQPQDDRQPTSSPPSPAPARPAPASTLHTGPTVGYPLPYPPLPAVVPSVPGMNNPENKGQPRFMRMYNGGWLKDLFGGGEAVEEEGVSDGELADDIGGEEVDGRADGEEGEGEATVSTAEEVMSAGLEVDGDSVEGINQEVQSLKVENEHEMGEGSVEKRTSSTFYQGQTSLGIENESKNQEMGASADEVVGEEIAAGDNRETVEADLQNGFGLCPFCENWQLSAEWFLPIGFSTMDQETGRGRESYIALGERGWDEFLEGSGLMMEGNEEDGGITRKKGCPLCALIVRAVKSSNDSLRKGLNLWDLKCSLFMVRFSCYWDHYETWESFRYLTVQCSHKNRELAVEYRDTLRHQDLTLTRTVVGFKSVLAADLLPVDCAKYPEAFVGRKIEPSLSPQLVKRWLKQCESCHGYRCYHGNPPNNEPATVRNRFDTNPDAVARFQEIKPILFFIDVDDMRLCRLPEGGRFVALSYVWGNSHSLLTTKENIEQLQQPGALKKVESKLSAVINDAIALTEDIGERYLWIDSLCIIQDDAETKQGCIRAMDVVYDNAILTIVAAEGLDATDGLPGVRSRPRASTQLSAMVAPNLELVCLSHFGGFSKSKYSSRAWTFQEYFYSPRRLIFYNGQAIFKCSWDSPFREDFLSEYQIFGIEDYIYKLPGTNMMDRSVLINWKRFAGHIAFRDIITDFTTRQLSHETGIMNAFAGFAALFAHDCGTELFFGLIKQALAFSLLWYPYPRIKKGGRRHGFPSWSWAGWRGTAIMHAPDVQFAKWTARYSWVKWSIYDKDSGAWKDIPQDFVEVTNEDLKHVLLGSSADPNSDFGRTLMANTQDSEPKYRSFLDKYPDIQRLDGDKSQEEVQREVIGRPASTSDLTSTPLSTRSQLTSHTLRFRTLTADVFISPYDHKGEFTSGNKDYVFIYDSEHRFIGYGFPTYEPFWDRAFELNDSENELAPLNNHFPVKLAFLAGPIVPQDDGLGPGVRVTQTTLSVPHFHGLLLSRAVEGSDSHWMELQGCYERMGVGVVALNPVEESMQGIEGMRGIFWEDVVLQ